MKPDSKIPLAAYGLGHRRDIDLDDLLRIDDPVVLFEGELTDEDGEKVRLYTVAGWLDGRNIATQEGGCLIGGQCIIISAKTRAEADVLAAEGLGDTIRMLAAEAFGKAMGTHGASFEAFRENPGKLRAALLTPGENAGIVTVAEVRQKRDR